jgi:hypothetical protein
LNQWSRFPRTWLALLRIKVKICASGIIHPLIMKEKTKADHGISAGGGYAA